MTTHCSQSPRSLFSPSFTGAHSSSHRLEDVAARVIRELSNEANPDAGIDFDPICEEFWAENSGLDSVERGFQEELERDRRFEEKGEDGGDDDEEEEEQEFEFPLISRDWVSCPVSRYPVFNTDLLLEAEVIMGRDYKEEEEKRPLPEKVIRLPLRMLFEEEREKAEIDELNGIPVGTYCVWKPKKKVEEVEEEGRRWNKNSSKRWKWPELIHRSSSDVGKSRFVFLDPVKSEDKKDKKKVEKVEKSKTAAGSLAEKLAEHGGDKRRSIWSGSFRKQFV